MKWIKVLEEVPAENQIIKIKIYNKKVCVVFHEDKLFAFSAVCPHAGADLSYGWCEKEQIICPVHRYTYSLNNGRGKVGQGDYLRTYPIEKRSDGIYISARKPWWYFLL